MSSPELNIEPRSVFIELMVSWILYSGGCPLSSLELNIEVRRVSIELTGVKY
jgi:hypothetical protein